MRFILAASLTLAICIVGVPAASQSPSSAAQPAQVEVTFTKHVAPILQNRCQVCHRPDTFAPMSLVTYEEVRPWARAIKVKVVAREMPPWFVDKNIGVQHFSNDASLTDEEIATIVSWVDGGAVRGNPADLPPPRTFPDEKRWQFGQYGEPDLVVPLPKDYILPGSGVDQWPNVLIDPKLTEDRYIAAVQIVPTKAIRPSITSAPHLWRLPTTRFTPARLMVPDRPLWTTWVYSSTSTRLARAPTCSARARGG